MDYAGLHFVNRVVQNIIPQNDLCASTTTIINTNGGNIFWKLVHRSKQFQRNYAKARWGCSGIMAHDGLQGASKMQHYRATNIPLICIPSIHLSMMSFEYSHSSDYYHMDSTLVGKGLINHRPAFYTRPRCLGWTFWWYNHNSTSIQILAPCFQF